MLHEYELVSFSVYNAHALIQGAEPPQTRSARTFRSRRPGKWASATLNADGLLSGLFENNGDVMEIQPVANLSPGVAASLLQANAHGGSAHVLQHFTFDGLFSHYVSRHARPKIAVDNIGGGGHHIFEIPEGAAAPHDSMGTYGADWGGEEWFPGCFSGDHQYYKFTFGVIADVPAFKAHGSNLQSLIESAVSDASMVYEKQMRIRLELGSLTIYQDDTTAPNYAMWCPPDFMSRKLEQLSEKPPDTFQGVVHLFTGCGDGAGTVGEAYVGTACNKDGTNIAVEQLRGRSSWLTFAHELGHNFAADHSFEEGQGKTGGVMDYGDGKLNGVYQFNSKYRKEQVCSKLRNIGSCKGKFLPTSPPPTPPPAPPAPPTTSAPSARRRSKGGGRRRKGTSRRRRRRRRRKETPDGDAADSTRRRRRRSE